MNNRNGIMKIAVISDLHYSNEKNAALPNRAGYLADTLLLRTVHRLNRYIRPDLVFIGGDLINNPEDPNAHELLCELKAIIDKVEAPTVVIPGNHDIEPEKFAQIFPLTEFIDVQGVRFLIFNDQETPGYNAVRSEQNLIRMQEQACSFDGVKVSLQHVPIFRPGELECPYNYTNADEVIKVMKSCEVSLAISGHFHPGCELIDNNSFSTIVAPAICEEPFRFGLIDISTTGKVSYNTEELSLSKELSLVDYHIHSHFAYCNENMDFVKTLDLAQKFGLKSISFSEHSSHLLTDIESYKKNRYYPNGIYPDISYDRSLKFLNSLPAYPKSFPYLRGLEIDIDANGNQLITPELQRQTDIFLGAVHYTVSKSYDALKQEFLKQTQCTLAHNVDILVHPFRAFRRKNMPEPEDLWRPVVEMLKESNTAAEINFHTNDPAPGFTEMCIEHGVKISFGSDAHNLYEVGEFYPHLEHVKEVGCYNNLHEVMYQHSHKTNAAKL